jgi:hypothetical protein
MSPQTFIISLSWKFSKLSSEFFLENIMDILLCKVQQVFLLLLNFSLAPFDQSLPSSPALSSHLSANHCSTLHCYKIRLFTSHIWDHLELVFLYLIYFTFYDCMLFHCASILHFLYLFISWWALRLFAFLGYSK